MMADELLKFQLALIFYKDERHNFILDYDIKARLSALWKQATIGRLDSICSAILFYPIIRAQDAVEVPPGFFDYVGKHRRAAWEELGDMPSSEAAVKFVAMLLETEASFKPWLDRRLQEKEDQDRRERERIESERLKRELAERERQAHLERERERERAILEQEREVQLAREAEQQRRLQEQQTNIERETQKIVEADGFTLGKVPPHDLPFVDYTKFVASAIGREDCTFSVGRGEIVTVRVPNSEISSRKILWQFCTVDYDIAFGLDYERTDKDQVIVESILPVMRCQSHEKVYVGSHTAIGPGNWLFNFDNTYSLFRSKTLYLRVASEAARLVQNTDIKTLS